MSEFERDLRQAVAIDSSARGGGGEGSIAAWFRDQFYYSELQVFEQSTWDEGGEQTNILGAKGPVSELGGLLLCAPLRSPEVLAPGDWLENNGRPFELVRRHSTYYGAGLLSGKIDLLCKLAALNRVSRSELKRPVWLAGLYGGEFSRDAGSGLLLEQPQLRPSAALMGLPTGLELATEHRGHLVFRVHLRRARNIWRQGTACSAWHIWVSGRAAHGSSPHLGKNAALIALNALQVLATPSLGLGIHNLRSGSNAHCVPASAEAILLCRQPALPALPTCLEVSAAPDDFDVSFPVNDALALLAWLRPRLEACLANPPQFDGAECEAPAENTPRLYQDAPTWNLGRLTTRPDGLELEYEFRATLEDDVEGLVGRIEALAAEATLRSTAHRVEIELLKDQPPFSPIDGHADRPLLHAARRALARAGLPPVESQTRGHSEAWILNACGIDTAVFGPGHPGFAPGAPGEWMPTRHLEVATHFYEAVIRQFCC